MPVAARMGVSPCRSVPRMKTTLRVRRVISSWREVRGWWETGGGVDRLLFRVLLDGGGVDSEAGVVVDLALERGYGWSLVRVLD